MSCNNCRRCGLPAVAKISAPAARAIAIAACPTPPVPEWISTLSADEILARSCRPYQAVADAVGTAAASSSGTSGGSVTAMARVARDERAPAPVGGHAADVIADPVAGDVRPDRGHHAGEVDAQLLPVSLEGRVPAEGDEDVREVDAGRGHRDLDLPGPGGTRSNAANSNDSTSPGVRICRRMPSRSCSTTVVRRSVGPQRSRAQPGGVPVAVPPGGLVFLRPAQQLPRHLLGRRARRRRRSGWRSGADARSRSPASDRAARPAPGWPGRRSARWQRSLVTHVEPWRLARKFGQLTGEAARGGSRSPGRGGRTVPAGSRSGGPVTTTTPLRPPSVSVPPPRWARSDPASTRRSAPSGQRHRRARRALGRQRIGQPGRQRVGRIGRVEQQPGSRVGLGDVGQVALLPFDGQQSLVQQSIGAVLLRAARRRAAVPRRSSARFRTGRAPRGRPRIRRPGMPSPA